MDETVGAAAGLVRLSFVVQAMYGEVSRDCGLTAAHAQLLCKLLTGPVGMAQLCVTLGLERSSMTGLVDRAEQRGLVERQPDPADRRAVRVAITPVGEEMIHRFDREITERLDDLLSDLPATEREYLHRALTKVTVKARAVFGG